MVAYPFNYAGGSVIYAKHLANELAKLGHSVTLLTTRQVGSKNKYPNYNFKIVEINHYGFILNAVPLVNIIPWFLKNYKKYDIIHVHSYMFLTTLELAFLKRILNYPFVIHVHGGLISNYNNNSIKLMLKEYFYDFSFGSFTLNSADKIFSVSKLDIIKVSKLFNISLSKISWLPNAVDLNKFKPQSSQKKNKNCFVLGFAGRLEKWKGADLIINIARYLKNKGICFKFKIAGHGILESEIRQKAKELNLNIELLGVVHHNNMHKFMKSIDILVVPSRIEGIPTVILEAMASGIPVVTTNVGGIPEIIINNKTGLMSNPDPIEISSNIINLIFDNNLYQTIQKNALCFVKSNYNWENIAKLALKYYKDVINKYI